MIRHPPFSKESMFKRNDVCYVFDSLGLWEVVLNIQSAFFTFNVCTWMSMFRSFVDILARQPHTFFQSKNWRPVKSWQIFVGFWSGNIQARAQTHFQLEGLLSRIVLFLSYAQAKKPKLATHPALRRNDNSGLLWMQHWTGAQCLNGLLVRQFSLETNGIPWLFRWFCRKGDGKSGISRHFLMFHSLSSYRLAK